MQEFFLHPKLMEDCFFVRELPLSRLLLLNNANFPWLILVPRVSEISEIFELTLANQHALIEEISQVSKILIDLYACDKINVAALGNQVPQLHVHIIARFKSDPAWPNSVWGWTSKAYHEPAKDELIKLIQEKLSF